MVIWPTSWSVSLRNPPAIMPAPSAAFFLLSAISAARTGSSRGSLWGGSFL